MTRGEGVVNAVVAESGARVACDDNFQDSMVSRIPYSSMLAFEMMEFSNDSRKRSLWLPRTLSIDRVPKS